MKTIVFKDDGWDYKYLYGDISHNCCKDKKDGCSCGYGYSGPHHDIATDTCLRDGPHIFVDTPPRIGSEASVETKIQDQESLPKGILLVGYWHYF